VSAQRHIRFEDEALQAALLWELDQGAVPYTLDGAGADLGYDLGSNFYIWLSNFNACGLIDQNPSC